MNYPELDKMTAVQDDTNTIIQFLEWLGEQEIRLAEYPMDTIDLVPIPLSTGQLIAKYFNIDLVKAEKEKKALLKLIKR